ncbi:hypothetical protein AURDEDRAFT_163597 [Auricularia subglabra TFB-10046 SS5]|nr:hypothetical protein AURDEDRAFT_163597 [Auricularia subglabra TFB-10046 SS5]
MFPFTINIKFEDTMFEASSHCALIEDGLVHLDRQTQMVRDFLHLDEVRPGTLAACDGDNRVPLDGPFAVGATAMVNLVAQTTSPISAFPMRKFADMKHGIELFNALARGPQAQSEAQAFETIFQFAPDAADLRSIHHSVRLLEDAPEDMVNGFKDLGRDRSTPRLMPRPLRGASNKVNVPPRSDALRGFIMMVHYVDGVHADRQLSARVRARILRERDDRGHRASEEDLPREAQGDPRTRLWASATTTGERDERQRRPPPRAKTADTEADEPDFPDIKLDELLVDMENFGIDDDKEQEEQL